MQQSAKFGFLAIASLVAAGVLGWIAIGHAEHSGTLLQERSRLIKEHPTDITQMRSLRRSAITEENLAWSAGAMAIIFATVAGASIFQAELFTKPKLHISSAQ